MKEQLKKMGAFEYHQTSFSYLDHATQTEHYVGVPEEGGRTLIPSMRSLQQQQHVSFIFSSHDPKILEAADDAVYIHDGRITSIERRHALAAELQP